MGGSFTVSLFRSIGKGAFRNILRSIEMALKVKLKDLTPQRRRREAGEGA